MSRIIKVDGEHIVSAHAVKYINARNTRGTALALGDTVVLDTANSSSTEVCCTVTTTQDDNLVLGMAMSTIGAGAYGPIQVEGPTKSLKVNGTSDIAAGDKLSTYTDEGIAAEASAGKGGVFAIALEAYTTNDSNGVIDAWLTGSVARFDSSSVSSAGALTFDAASAPAGTSVYAVHDNSGDLTLNCKTGKEIHFAIAGTDEVDIGGTETVINEASGDRNFRVETSECAYALYTDGGKDAIVLGDNTDSSSADKLVNVARATRTSTANTSYADLWVQPSGAVTVPTGTTGVVASAYFKEPNISATGTVTSAATVYIADAPDEGGTNNNSLHVASGTTLLGGALTISSGGFTVTGDSTVTGTFGVTGNTTITGDLTINGNLNWGATLTVDELILDTDGSPPAASNCYVVRDNSGDLTLNAITGKTINLAIAGNDEVTLSGTVLALNANTLALDTDSDTYFDNGTDDTIKIYISSANDFNFAANSFDVLTGSAVNLADSCHLQFGTNDDIVMLHSGAVNADTTVSNVIEGTADTMATAADSLIISNVTNDGDIHIIVSDGGNSKTMILCDGDTGSLYLNSVATGYLTVGCTTEYSWNATTFDFESGNNLKFKGDNGILDSAGNELIQFTATGSAVNYLQVINAATANPITLQCLGTADKGFDFEAADNEEILCLRATASAIEEITITSAAAGGGAAIKATTSATNASLRLDTSGTGYIYFMSGGDECLAMADAGLTFAAAADTAGHACYIQTEDGGADSGAGTGRAGAALEIRAGDGSASATATAVGGAGANLTLVAGAGGNGNTTGHGGDGGDVIITAGAAGDSGAGAGVGGYGGDILLTAGAGGGAGGGTAGEPGNVKIQSGCLFMQCQDIDMSDADVTLTLVPGTPTGTTLTGNILRVDPEGGAHILKLPPEGDCTGLFLIIDNDADAAENITVQNDAGGAVGTVGQDERGYFTCDGTTWLHSTGVA